MTASALLSSVSASVSVSVSASASDGACERAARESYGRLLAWLAYRWRDLAGAEDALSDALLAALTAWPRTGVPDAPEAWLLTAARHKLLQAQRHQAVVDDPRVTALFDVAEAATLAPASIPDDRLRLLFVCAHPALDARTHTPLMLQTVLGLDARQIASVFLVSPATMAQRLVRAKAKIRDAGIRYEEPEPRELPRRLDAVLAAIYAAYTTGWDAPHDADGFADEALYLARLTAALLPDAAEAQGLLALLMFCQARRAAQVGPGGAFVPLAEQDTARWDMQAIAKANAVLREASKQQAPGPFQIEAAIQSAHCERAYSGRTPVAEIAGLYDLLAGFWPSLGVTINQAVAVAQAGDLPRAQALLGTIDEADVASYQPYWVARTHLARLAGDLAAARRDAERALGLTVQPALRAHLSAQ
ncbi:RNA polymerase sigma factor [soil metagenome]